MLPTFCTLFWTQNAELAAFSKRVYLTHSSLMKKKNSSTLSCALSDLKAMWLQCRCRIFNHCRKHWETPRRPLKIYWVKSTCKVCCRQRPQKFVFFFFFLKSIQIQTDGSFGVRTVTNPVKFAKLIESVKAVVGIWTESSQCEQLQT